MRLPRFRIWFLMAAVAVIGISLAVPQMYGRWKMARARAADYEQMEQGARSLSLYWRKLGELYTDPPKDDTERLRRERDVDALWRRSQPARTTFVGPDEIDEIGRKRIIWRATSSAHAHEVVADELRQRKETCRRAAVRVWEALPPEPTGSRQITGQ